MIICGRDELSYQPANYTLSESMLCAIDRTIAESVVLCIVYLGLTILSFVSNGCVILLAIWERCPELDSLTFVLVTSLSFNQLFISFFIYPLVSYSVIARVWDLQSLWCWFCALVSSYLYTVYFLHILILALDMLVVKHCDVRTLMSVSVSKTVALTTWAIALAPQLFPALSGDKDYNYQYDPIQAGCFQTLIFSSTSDLLLAGGLYIICPVIAIAVRYMHLLINEDDRRNLAATISRRLFDTPTIGVRNYRTPASIGFMGLLTACPWLLYKITKAGENNEHPRLLVELLQLLLSLSSVLVPGIYLATVPTYFRQVFSQDRFPYLYKIGFGRKIPVRNSSKRRQFRRDILEKPITTIQEEEESEEYIELPAVTITIQGSSPKSHQRKVEDGITFKNGHASVNGAENVELIPSE